MEKYIEAIIEIVLGHVTCCHLIDEEYPRGPKHDDVTYGIDSEKLVIEKCLKLKPEPKVAEDWIAGEPYWPKTKPFNKEEFIEKYARAMHKEVYGSLMKCNYQCQMMGKFRVQIRKIVEAK